MHRCLTILEIQHAIFQQVHDDPREKAMLARLARTCRTFTNVALDVLWSELASITYLIRSLPHDLWYVDRIAFVTQTFEFKRAMLRSDWEIFFRYSSRVRSLKFVRGLNLDRNAIIVLSQPPSCGPLFPNLKSLLLYDSGEEYLPLLLSFFTPCLTDLHLPCAAVWLPEILKCLVSRCSLLTSFHIQGYGNPDAEGQKNLSETLFPRLRLLKSLTCPALDEAAFINLSRLPSLVNLSGHLVDNLQLERARSCLISPAFVSLRSLTLYLGGNELSTLTSLLELMHFKPQTLSFKTDISPTPDMFRSFFIALANACDPECISDISLAVEPDDWLDSTERHQISLSTFEALLVLPNVESFVLDTMCNISLDDDAIDTLTKQWPKLTSLSFNSSFGWGIRSRVTHMGLIRLLSRCAALIDFGLAIDFRGIDVPPLSMPSINFPITIAAFLSDICPELDEITSSFQYEDFVPEFRIHAERWQEVDKWLPVFLTVRRQHMDSSEGDEGE